MRAVDDQLDALLLTVLEAFDVVSETADQKRAAAVVEIQHVIKVAREQEVGRAGALQDLRKQVDHRDWLEYHRAQ